MKVFCLSTKQLFIGIVLCDLRVLKLLLCSGELLVIVEHCRLSGTCVRQQALMALASLTQDTHPCDCP